MQAALKNRGSYVHHQFIRLDYSVGNMVKRNRIISNLVLIIALAFIFIWRLSIIDGSLWIDEHHLVASVMTADSFFSLFNTNENANLHHGYAALIYFILTFFEFSEVLVRIPSFIASIVSFAIFYHILGLFSKNRAHNLFLSLLFSSLLLNQHFSTEARGYALSLMFVLLSFYFTAIALRAINSSAHLLKIAGLSLAGSASLGLSVLSHNSAAWFYAASLFAMAVILLLRLVNDKRVSVKSAKLLYLIALQLIVVILIAGKSMLLTIETLKTWSSQDYLFDEISIGFFNRLGNELFSLPNIPYVGLSLLLICGLLLFFSILRLFKDNRLLTSVQNSYFLFLTAFLYLVPATYLYITKPFFLFTRFFYVFTPFIFLIPIYVYNKISPYKTIKLFYIVLIPVVIYGLIVFPLYPKCPYKEVFNYLDAKRKNPNITINVFVKERFKDTTKRQNIVYRKYLANKNIRLVSVSNLRGVCSKVNRTEYCVAIHEVVFADHRVEINPFAEVSGFEETLFYPFRRERTDGLKTFHSNHWLSSNDIVILYSDIGT